MFASSWPTHSLPVGRPPRKSNNQKGAWGMGCQCENTKLDYSRAQLHNAMHLLIRVDTESRGQDPHSPRPVLRWIVQNFACVTNYPHHASIFNLLIILDISLCVFNKNAINSCRTWVQPTSLMGFCFVMALCCIDCVCAELSEGKLRRESWGASLCSLHVPRLVCVFFIPGPTSWDEHLSVPTAMGFVQP